MNALGQYRRKDRGLPDYLNWGSIVAPGVILNKDGSLLVGRYFKGGNLAHRDDTIWYSTSDNAGRALCKLDGGWAVWIDGVRLPMSRFTDPAHNHFPDDISALIEDERRETLTREGACFASEYAILLHYMPPLKHKGRLVDWFYEGGGATQSSTANIVLAEFQKKIAEFDDQMEAAVSIRPMTDHQWTDDDGTAHYTSELVNYLQFCVSGEFIDISLPPDAVFYLDGVVGEKEVTPGDMPKIGDMYMACIALSGYPFPAGSTPGMLSSLDMLPFPLRWSSRYIVLEQPEAAKQGSRIENKWKQKARGFKGILFGDQVALDPDASKMTFDASKMIERTQSAMEGTGYYTANVILMDENVGVLEAHVRQVRRTIRDAGFPTRLEGLNAMEAWIGTLPGHPVANVRRSLVHTNNLADLLPLNAPWEGDAYVPCPMYPTHSPPLLQCVTVGSTPIDVCLHNGDLAHTVTFGPPGSGKSTLQAVLAAQFRRYKHASVWGFDKGRSLMPIYRAMGKFYDIGNDTKFSFCPLQILETDADVVETEGWIADCFHLQTGAPARPYHLDAIHQGIQSLRNSTGRSISHFIRQVQNQEVRDAMTFYSLNGPAGYLFDSEEDSLADAPVCGFEISQLMGMGEKTLLPAFRYIARRFVRMLKGQPGLLQISEAWTMFGHPAMRDKVFEWLKELRKANVCVILDTQSLSDAQRSGILDVILENCQTRFYGANPAAMIGSEDEPGPRQLYHKFGLIDAQIEMIRQAIPKRHYLYQRGEDAALIDLRLGKKTLAFCGAGSKEDLAHIDTLFERHGDDWPQVWLRERTLT